MPSSGLMLCRICSLVILSTWVFSLFVTPASSAPVEDHIQDEVYQQLWNKLLLKQLMSSDEEPLGGRTLNRQDIDEENDTRIKRIGIAGLENLDILSTSLDKNRSRGGRLSMSLSMPRLAAMLRKLTPS
ncbi:hypothetical protein ScPMuIL_015764 [Solemya velum]